MKMQSTNKRKKTVESPRSNKTQKLNPTALSAQFPSSIGNSNIIGKSYNVKVVNLPLSVTILQIISHFSLDAKTTVWLKCIVEDGEVSCTLEIEDNELYERVLLKNNTKLKNRKIQVLPDEKSDLEYEDIESDEENNFDDDIESIHSTDHETVPEIIKIPPVVEKPKSILKSPKKENNRKKISIKQEIIEEQEEQVKQRISVIEAAKEHASSNVQVNGPKSAKESRNSIYYVSVENLPSIIKVNQIVKHFSLNGNNRIKFIKSGISGGKVCKLRFQDKELFQKALEKHHSYIGDNRIDVFPDPIKISQQGNECNVANSTETSIEETSEDSSEESDNENMKPDNIVSSTPERNVSNKPEIGERNSMGCDLREDNHQETSSEIDRSIEVLYEEDDINSTAPNDLNQMITQSNQNRINQSASGDKGHPQPKQDFLNSSSSREIRRESQSKQDSLNSSSSREIRREPHSNQDLMNPNNSGESRHSKQDLLNTSSSRDLRHSQQDSRNTSSLRERRLSHSKQDSLNGSICRETQYSHSKQDSLNTSSSRERRHSHSKQDLIETNGSREERLTQLNHDQTHSGSFKETRFSQSNQNHMITNVIQDQHYHHQPIQSINPTNDKYHHVHHVQESESLLDNRERRQSQPDEITNSRNEHFNTNHKNLSPQDNRDSEYVSPMQEANSNPTFEEKEYNLFLSNCPIVNKRQICGHLGLKLHQAKIVFSVSKNGLPICYIQVYTREHFQQCLAKDNQIFFRKKIKIQEDRRFFHNKRTVDNSNYNNSPKINQEIPPGKRKRTDAEEEKLHRDKPNTIIKFTDEPEYQEPSTSKVEVVKERPNRIIKFNESGSPSTSVPKNKKTFNVHVKNLPFGTTEKMLKKILGFDNEEPVITLQTTPNQKVDSFVKFKRLENFMTALSKNCTVINKSLIEVYPDENSIEKKSSRSRGLGVKRGNLKRRNVINRSEYLNNKAFHEYQQREMGHDEDNYGDIENISDYMRR